MSLAAVRLDKVPAQEAGTVCYRVMSPDFSRDHSWEEIGRLVIDPVAEQFTFESTGIWSNERVVPPWVYDLQASEMHRALTNEFAGAGYGAWTGRIRSAARRLMRAGMYPDSA